MRILAIADIHRNLSIYNWLLGLTNKEQADVLVLCGYLLIGGWEDE